MVEARILAEASAYGAAESKDALSSAIKILRNTCKKYFEEFAKGNKTDTDEELSKATRLSHLKFRAWREAHSSSVRSSTR